MIQVVVTGSECTGKTTLARALAAHFRTLWVPEYARRFVEERGGAPDHEDVAAIARGQMALEDSRIAGDARLLIKDTDLLSTVVYSHHYYGDCPPFVEQALLERAADLYLLAGIDVPWTADGDQRDRGDRREEMHELFCRALENRGLTFVEVQGSRRRRLELAISAIDGLVSPTDEPEDAIPPGVRLSP